MDAYAPEVLARRFQRWKDNKGFPSFSAALHPLLRDPAMMQSLLQFVTIGVTEMFRDPNVFKLLRSNVVPQLATSVRTRVWHVGCSSGEEAFSMAILLFEQNLHSHSQIYATDINETVLTSARSGTFKLESMKKATSNYHLSGGTRSFGDYFRVHQDKAVMDPMLKGSIVFANHNAVSDADFGAMDIIFCRNVLIYYGQSAKLYCLKLLDSSLRIGGFFGFGIARNLRVISTSRQLRRIRAR